MSTFKPHRMQGLFPTDKERALQHLQSLDPTTVIDDGYWDCFMYDMTTLNALLVFTGMKSYGELHEKYEGFTIEELIEEIENPVLLYDCDNEPIRKGDKYWFIDGTNFINTLEAEKENHFSALTRVRFKSAESMLNFLMEKEVCIKW